MLSRSSPTPTSSGSRWDTLTDGGRGIALLWPFTNDRYFAPWRPLEVAPIGLGIVSPAGIWLMLHEAIWFLPFWVIAFWPTRKEAISGRP